jgi:hypothetical protein
VIDLPGGSAGRGSHRVAGSSAGSSDHGASGGWVIAGGAWSIELDAEMRGPGAAEAWPGIPLRRLAAGVTGSRRVPGR